MTTGPSPINNSAAGSSLSKLTSQVSQRKQEELSTRVDSESIADTFETSDREGDGRACLPANECDVETDRAGEIGDQLDLTG